MSKERITDEPDEPDCRQEQKQEEPFADLKRLDARVQRLVDDAKVLNLRESLIREGAKSTAFVAAAFGALAMAMAAFLPRGKPMSRSETEMTLFAGLVTVILGHIAAICCRKTARIWRDYRRAKSSRQRRSDRRASITDKQDA